MPRQPRRPNVFGPYRHGNGYRLVVRNERGETTATETLDTVEEAQARKRVIARGLAALVDGRTVQQAVDAYEVHVRESKGNKARSTVTTVFRLRAMFGEDLLELGLHALTPARCASRYAEVSAVDEDGKPLHYAVDTHRNMLAEAKTFLNWCVAKKWITRNPFADVSGKGRRKHGKEQLRIDEARRWLDKAIDYAVVEDGAVAALVTLLMGLRCTEVVSRIVRDLDDDGRLLWIPDSKTDAGRRVVEVPELLRVHLARVAADKLPGAPLFGVCRPHDRAWPRKWVARICADAGVPEVTAHSMRGLHATLAMARGTSSHVVASSLGHASDTVTLTSYADRSVVDGARQRAALEVLAGGK
jgi:integrase